MSIKKIIKTSSLYKVLNHFYIYNPFLREIRISRDEKKNFLKEAESRFKTEKPLVGSYKDYKKAFRKHRVTYSEYMFSYEYWRLNENQRDEFISTSEMRCLYRKRGSSHVREVFHDKVVFLKEFHDFVHRKWVLVKDLSFDQFKMMITRFDCIAKPIGGSQGNGIFKICAKDIEDWNGLYEKCVRENILLEECVHACEEIEEFHPQSLNTIRVVTISNKDSCVVFGALFRMGVHGSVIDNTHAGGVYAPINLKTGTIDIEAIDSNNNKYEYHPDSHKRIKGFKIPYWDQIIETCQRATRTIPDIHFAGWDLCVTNDGRVEIIEGNHAPDFDGGMQAPLKTGVKKKVQQTVIDLMRVDPIRLLSIWRYK